jgi:hypothetical protein
MRYARPTLTRVGVAPAALAHRAVAMLIERLNGTQTGAPRTEILDCASSNSTAHDARWPSSIPPTHRLSTSPSTGEVGRGC